MIYGDVFAIAIQLELVMICDAIKCGMFSFVIDGQLLPGKGISIEFYPTIEELRDSLRLSLEKTVLDIGVVPIEKIDFSSDIPGIIDLNAAMLFDFGFCCYLGFDGSEDRFFYSSDYEETFQEKRYPRGTIEHLINSLPKIEDIDFCNPAAVKNFEGSLSATEFKQMSTPSCYPNNKNRPYLVLTNKAVADRNNQVGDEPSYLKKLFEDSLALPGGCTRYTRDPEGHIHRFTESKAGLYHWSGSTGDNKNPLPLRDKVKAQLQKKFGWECR